MRYDVTLYAVVKIAVPAVYAANHLQALRKALARGAVLIPNTDGEVQMAFAELQAKNGAAYSAHRSVEDGAWKTHREQ